MAYSRQDLIALVLQNLGVLAAGQEASTEDRAAVDVRIGPKLAELAKREILTGLDADALDDAVFLYVADVVAYAARFAFGINGAKAEGLAAANTAAEVALRGLARQYDLGTGTGAVLDAPQAVLEILGVVEAGQTASDKDRVVVAQRLPSIYADLKNREIVTVTSFASADPSVQSHLVTIIAARLAPQFGIGGEPAKALTIEALRAEDAMRVISRQLDTGLATNGSFDLIQVVLENLGAVAVGRTATNKDRAIIAARVVAVLDDLRQREVIDLPDLATADTSTLLQLSFILTSVCAISWGIPADVRAGLRAEADRAEIALRAMTRQLDSGAGTAGAFDVPQVVLETLGVVSAGQTASHKDRAVITGRYGALLGSLRRREIIDLASVPGADAGTQPHLAAILSAWCAPQFGLDAARVVALKAEAVAAEAELRRIARQLDTGAATSGTFDAIQSALETLLVVEPGQTATAKDRAVVSARVAPMLADLKRRDIIDIGSLAAADAGVQYHLAAILASWCAVSFRIAGDALVAIKAGAGEAETALRLIGRQLDGGVATGGTFDVVQAVLENLGVVAAGYTGSAKDRAVVNARVEPTLKDLGLRLIAAIPSIGEADPSTLIHLSVILTSACAQAFGKDATTRALLAAEAVKAETALLALARQLDTGIAVSGDFDPVQVVLEHLGVVEAGQTASDADRNVVLARVQPKFMELRGRDICGVTDLSLLTPDLQGPFARLLAAECASSFSEADPRRVAALVADVERQEGILRYQSFVYDARPPLRVERFWGGRRGGWAC